jgi:hypothetical protein
MQLHNSKVYTGERKQSSASFLEKLQGFNQGAYEQGWQKRTGTKQTVDIYLMGIQEKSQIPPLLLSLHRWQCALFLEVKFTFQIATCHPEQRAVIRRPLQGAAIGVVRVRASLLTSCPYQALKLKSHHINPRTYYKYQCSSFRTSL